MDYSEGTGQRRAFILDRADRMKQAKEVYSSKWNEYEKIYRMVEENRTGEDYWRASLPDTWAFATIKTAQAAFVDSKVIPTIIAHRDDPSTKAEDLRDLYTDIAEKGNLDSELYFARLDAFKLGNGFLYTFYEKKSRPVWDIKKFDPEKGTFEWKKTDRNEFDDPKTVRVSPYLVLLDDMGRQGNYRDAIILEVCGRDEAEDRYGHLVDFDKVPKSTVLLSSLKAQGETKVAETDGTGLQGSDITNYTFFAPGFDWADDVVEILHYWNVGLRTPSGTSDSYEILINGYPAQVDTEGKQSPNPYIHKQIPLTLIPYSPYSGDEIWASGIIEIGQREAEAIRQHREMMSDRQKIALLAPVFSDVNDEIDQQQVVLSPLSIIRTKGGVPKPIQIQGITNADLALETSYEQSYKRATGIDERILGLESSGPKLTATEVSFLREAALKRLKEFAFLYKNALLHSEIKLKLSLFKQYFSNPITRESKVKNDKGLRALKASFKQFKVKTSNTYVKKGIDPNYFEGEADVDLDMQLLMPMTQSQMVTMWSQILRDAVPFVQAGIIPNILPKTFDEYVKSLGTSMAALKENDEQTSVDMAEAEHDLYANPETAKDVDSVLVNGTPEKYLSADHIARHEELLDADVDIEDRQKLMLIKHIQKDIANLQTKVETEKRENTPLTPEGVAGVGGMGAAPGTVPSAPIKPTEQNKLG